MGYFRRRKALPLDRKYLPDWISLVVGFPLVVAFATLAVHTFSLHWGAAFMTVIWLLECMLALWCLLSTVRTIFFEYVPDGPCDCECRLGFPFVVQVLLGLGLLSSGVVWWCRAMPNLDGYVFALVCIVLQLAPYYLMIRATARALIWFASFHAVYAVLVFGPVLLLPSPLSSAVPALLATGAAVSTPLDPILQQVVSGICTARLSVALTSVTLDPQLTVWSSTEFTPFDAGTSKFDTEPVELEVRFPTSRQDLLDIQSDIQRHIEARPSRTMDAEKPATELAELFEQLHAKLPQATNELLLEKAAFELAEADKRPWPCWAASAAQQTPQLFRSPELAMAHQKQSSPVQWLSRTQDL